MACWRKVGVIAVLAVIPVWTTTADAASCDGSKTIFEDEFRDDSGGWPIVPEFIRVEDGSLVVTAPAQKMEKAINVTNSVKSGDICVEVAFKNMPISPAGSAGLLFWVRGPNDYYTLQVSPRGAVGIFRFKEQWLPLRPMLEDSSVNKGQDAVNNLRVKADGNLVTLFVNGAKIREVRGDPPAPDWQFGVYTAATNEKLGTSSFRHFKVTSTDD